jgi:hypothetical protein
VVRAPASERRFGPMMRWNYGNSSGVIIAYIEIWASRGTFSFALCVRRSKFSPGRGCRRDSIRRCRRRWWSRPRHARGYNAARSVHPPPGRDPTETRRPAAAGDRHISSMGKRRRRRTCPRAREPKRDQVQPIEITRFQIKRTGANRTRESIAATGSENEGFDVCAPSITFL